jgi:hypothetical protein
MLSCTPTETNQNPTTNLEPQPTTGGAGARSRGPGNMRGSSEQKALTTSDRVPNQFSPIRSFVTQEDMIYYRVYSGERNVGGFLVGVPPVGADEAVAGLALPPENTANFLQEVLVPAGTRLQSSIAAPAFGQPGGLLQFELLDQIPIKNFGPGVRFR